MLLTPNILLNVLAHPYNVRMGRIISVRFEFREKRPFSVVVNIKRLLNIR